MSVVSQGSVQVDPDGRNDSIDNISAITNPDVALIVTSSNAGPRQRGWNPFRRNDNNATTVIPTNDNESYKAMFFTCRCKGGVNAACLITCSSIIELIVNMVGIVYGIAFIQSACKFYSADAEAERNEEEYNQELERVLFLEKYRIGLVGLLATCLVGLTVSFLMPFGTIYKSWKSLRAAMSLLFSICLAHILLTSIYLRDNQLSATLAAVPFRVFEILVMWSHIAAYKRKKLEDKLKGAGKKTTGGSRTGSVVPISSMIQNNLKGKMKGGTLIANVKQGVSTGNKQLDALLADDSLNEGMMKLREHILKKRNNQLTPHQEQTWEKEFQRQLHYTTMLV